tara:strand:+ start:6459 stop:7424 length:966 start_codon:yes stop_codon:yes gene_type:complete
MLSLQSVFPLLAIAVSWLAWNDPQPLLGWNVAVIPLLMFIMFCMGLTLRAQDFRRILRKPEPVAMGVTLQYLLMPLLGWLLVHLLALPDEVALGVILVGVCAGGTASNVMTYLAGGDVALSISMTLLSTLWGVVLTPWLLSFYASASVSVDILAILLTTAKIVVLPIIAGIAINHYLPALRQAVNKQLANTATVAILAIIAIVVALNADEIATVGVMTLLAVALHNLLGTALGYTLARWRGFTEVECRTIAIEVGMQNSGLGAALALQFFTPLTALPAALFSVWHNLSGALLASWWRWQTRRRIRQLQTASVVSKTDNAKP